MSETNFPPITRAQWEAKASKDLRGRPLAKLTHRTADGIEISPLYSRDGSVGGAGPAAGARRGWRSVQELHHADPQLANAAARRDLELGADGVFFVLDSELRAGRTPDSGHDGLVCDPADSLETLLAGIDPRKTPVFIDAGLQAPAWADAFEEWLDNLPELEGEAGASAGHAVLGQGPALGGIVYDPLAALTVTGSLEAGFEGALGRLVDTVLGMRTGLLGVSTRPYHDAGASDGHELALALATCAEYLRCGAGLGLEISDLIDSMLWTLPVTGRPFEAIAKLRAARIVWAKFCAAAGLEPQSPATLWIHATSSQREWTRRGPWVNLLRGTVGSFAAAVGGANSIATGAFDGLCGPEGGEVLGLGRGSALGRRLGLNTQLILREESHLGQVGDPAAGSFYVEALSDALARAAWTRFRAIEASGGLCAGLRSGAIQAELAGGAQSLRARVATRKRPLTGLSTFPVLEDQVTPEQVPNHSEAESPEPARLGPVLEAAEVAPLEALRLASPFERLRDASETWTAREGQRPSIFACALGRVAHHQARRDFAANGFRAAGIELVGGEGLALEHSASHVGEKLRESGASIAVICGRDEDYVTHAAGLVAALHAAGAKQVWIAGRPMELEQEARFVHLGCDLLAELEHALGVLEVIDTQQGEG